MHRALAVLGVALLALFTGLRAEAAGGGRGARKAAQSAAAVAARALYEQGLDQRDAAARLEREGQGGAAQAAWESAIGRYREALAQDGELYEAHSDLGYALRKLGRFQDSLGAYAEALRIEPAYPRALEYQGEAFLAVGRPADARANYLKLAPLDAEQAGQLLSAMARWVELSRAKPPAGVDAAALTEFAAWVSERGGQPGVGAAGSQW